MTNSGVKLVWLDKVLFWPFSTCFLRSSWNFSHFTKSGISSLSFTRDYFPDYWTWSSSALASLPPCLFQYIGKMRLSSVPLRKIILLIRTVNNIPIGIRKTVSNWWFSFLFTSLWIISWWHTSLVCFPSSWKLKGTSVQTILSKIVWMTFRIPNRRLNMNLNNSIQAHSLIALSDTITFSSQSWLDFQFLVQSLVFIQLVPSS